MNRTRSGKNPEHRIMITEYGDVRDGMATRTVLETAGRYRLIHGTAGYGCAGSWARLTDEKRGVLFDVDDCRWG